MNLDWSEAKYWIHHCLLLVLSEKPADLINQIKKAGMKVIIFNFLEIIHVQYIHALNEVRQDLKAS